MNAEEQSELQRALSAEPTFIDFYNSIISGTEIHDGLHALTSVNVNAAVQRLLANTTVPDNRPVVHRVHLLKTAWFRYAAAIVLLIGIGAYLWNNNQKEPATRTSSSEARSAKDDILPGGQKAILTLADGSTIILDSAANGKLAIQGNSNIIKKDGQIVYDYERGSYPPSEEVARSAGGGLEGGPASYNTMTTPKGGQYQLTLSDGTKVWLNAASSITYPITFPGKTREVTITGEAYFEVAKDKLKPFIVKTQNESITVLGTSFNVNAYPDEKTMKTTLIDGSVKVTALRSSTGVILQPGQAFVNGKTITANVQQDVAWKNGVFDFNKMPLDVVMRQLARWYDLTIIYESDYKNIVVGGKMGRDLNLSQVLIILSDMQVKYRLEGKKLIIL